MTCPTCGSDHHKLAAYGPGWVCRDKFHDSDDGALDLDQVADELREAMELLEQNCVMRCYDKLVALVGRLEPTKSTKPR